ncbi:MULTISPECIES: hypothetical protein [Desulfosediminicola]|uniref:hypothetical protein n=1 Tax=Desulfosediminicola TaxID=2886823 RepID=UPI0010ABF09E|nr:hypothetical protein [Desulfosediminicola ganghwensis]
MMKTAKCRIASLFTLFVCLAFISSCGGNEFVYQDSNEMKPGSGLISGEDGVFTVYSGTLGIDREKDNDSAK